ncbi:hypothetical protein, partial [Aeromonas caviae]
GTQYKKPRSLERGFLLPEIQHSLEGKRALWCCSSFTCCLPVPEKVAAALAALNPHVGSLRFHHFSRNNPVGSVLSKPAARAAIGVVSES